MAMQLVFSLFFFVFFLFLISTNGRSLHKNYTSENDVKVRAVSFAADTYTGQTNYNDVLGLATLCVVYPWLLENNDDPCLRPRWTWIECNSDPKPRIISLNLRSKISVGTLPDFSVMDALQTIDLSLNTLSGPIPSFLGTFPGLQELNLEYNRFTGLVPDSIACNKNLKLSLTGNTNLYTSGSCSTSTNTPTTSSRKKNNLPIILGSTISVFLLFWIVVGVFAIFRHKAKTAAAVAEASKVQGQSNPKSNIPTEEMPIKGRPDNMSP